MTQKFREIRCAENWRAVRHGPSPLANNFGKERKFCLKKNFAREKLELEQAVEELRQIFINGKTGLKGKLKKDFVYLLSDIKHCLIFRIIGMKKQLKEMERK
jgi:hypothetical protein